MITLSSLSTELSAKMRYPGALYRLPVPHNMPVPGTISFFIILDNTLPISPGENANASIGNAWRNDETFLYVYSKHQEIIIRAKVRPFLFIRRFVVKDYFWQGDNYLGLPITSEKTRMINSETKKTKL